MRALSLTQPWAWLVVHGGKDIENRRWNTKFRGEFLIHAAKGMTRRDYSQALLFAGCVAGLPIRQAPLFDELERGGIIGVAELCDVVAPTSVPHIQWALRWHMREQYGFRLRNVRPLPFLPCKGALSFWGNFEIRDGKAVQL
jgi:hypothetical protein